MSKATEKRLGSVSSKTIIDQGKREVPDFVEYFSTFEQIFANQQANDIGGFNVYSSVFNARERPAYSRNMYKATQFGSKSHTTEGGMVCVNAFSRQKALYWKTRTG